METGTPTPCLGTQDHAFDSFACHYDAFTDHPAYAAWIRRLELLARSHGLTGRRALDIGCGTGKSLLPLLELGYEVVGCDAAGEMLACAAAKTRDRATLVHVAAEDLPVLGAFDYITCLNDVCNYITKPDTLRAAFHNVATNLADDGIFLFDANTAVTYYDFFAQTHWREAPGLKMVWHGPTRNQVASNETLTATVEIFAYEPQSGLWRHHVSTHVQRHYEHDVITDLLSAAGLRVEALYGQTDAGPPEQPVDHERHTKALYIVKPAG